MIKNETLKEAILSMDRETAIHLLANSDSLTEQFTEDEFMEWVTFDFHDPLEHRLRARVFRAIYRKAKLSEKAKREIKREMRNQTETKGDQK